MRTLGEHFLFEHFYWLSIGYF